MKSQTEAVFDADEQVREYGADNEGNGAFRFDLYVLPASQVLGLEPFNCMISGLLEPNQST
jgi:hypothetical protein